MANNWRKKLFSKILNNSELISAGKKMVANIRFRDEGTNNKVISVVSASKNDGKSTVAVQLANAFALSGYNTLLLDTDVHHKTLSRALRNENGYSLYDILNENCIIEQAIVQTEREHLYFLDCARNISSSPELIATSKFKSLLNILKNNFDYIVVDTSPVLPCIDGVLLSQYSDSSIVVVRQYKTKVDEVDQLIEQLDVSGVKVLGCVLNFGDRSEYMYY